MRKSKKIFLILTLILIAINLTGCGKNDTNEETTDKISKELDYLDTEIVSILNRLNNLSLRNYTITEEEINMEKESSGGSSDSEESSGQQDSGGTKKSDSQNNSGSESQKESVTITGMEPNTILTLNENDIDWDMIKNEIERINEAWGIIILDLSYVNANNNDILSFSSSLNDALLSIKDENKVSALSNIAKVYSFIPKFEQQISADNSMQNIKQVKSYLINAYSLVEQEDWAAIEKNINDAETTFKNITNDIEYVKNREFKVNKTYVSLKELQNSLSYRDKKLFLIKYKNLIENINAL